MLALVNNEVIIFSDKESELKLPPIEEDGSMRGDQLNRWMKRAVHNSADQLWGAERRILNNPGNICRDAAAQCPLFFSSDSQIAKVHLVAVANGAQSAMSEFWGEAKTPMLMPNSVFRGKKPHNIDWPIHPATGMEKMFIREGSISNLNLEARKTIQCCAFQIGDLDPARTFVHVFDEMALQFVMEEMNTGIDLVKYLTKREAAFRNDKFSFIAVDEGALVFHYQSHIGPDNEHDFYFVQDAEKNLQGRADFIVVNRGEDNEKLRKQYAAKKREDKASYWWDDLLMNAIHENPELYGSDGERTRTLAIMARESRLHRRGICQHMDRSMAKIGKDKRWMGMRPSDGFPECAYVLFAASECNTKVQSKVIEAACILALDNNPSLRVVVGLFRSEEFSCIMSVSRAEISEGDIEMARKVGEKFDLFKNVKMSMEHLQEFPDE